MTVKQLINKLKRQKGKQMTREEAIYRLRNTAWLGSNEDREATEEAVRMAIVDMRMMPKLLEQQGDLISRAEAIEAKKPGSAAYEKILSEFVLDDEVKETIREFIKMRKLIKAPMTEKALSLMINKLRGMAADPETQIAILNQSIENSWKGIFPLRDEIPKKNKTAQQLDESYNMLSAWAESEE